jgi:hypothetical protein
MLALSRAANHPGFPKLAKGRRCQILINRANLLNTVGRSIDAIADWDEALRIDQRLAMVLGNRGARLKHYAGMVVDNRERAILVLHAYDSLCAATAADAVYESPDPLPVIAQFREVADQLARVLDVDAARAMQRLDQGKPRRSKTERAYRQRCLNKRLFLCR